MSDKPTTNDELANDALRSLRAQLLCDFRDHAPITSQHEGYALLLERMEVLWEAIKRRERAEAMAEAFAVASLAMRFVIEAPITHQSHE